jgi:Ran GTPase-activating protein (RanGAP) involved in mRNA processing and transport
MQTITILNLSNNQIADEGTRHLATVLNQNTVTLIVISSLSLYSYFFTQQITTLDLSNNQIGDIGAESLLKVLKTNEVIFAVSSFLLLTFSFVKSDTHRTQSGIQ